MGRPPAGGSSRRTSLPLVSVVVASTLDAHLLQARLAAIVADCRRLRAEVVVARAATGTALDALARTFPTAGFVEGPAGASLAQLRALAMGEVTGDIVLFADEASALDARVVDALAGEANTDEPGATEAPSQRSAPR